MRKRLILMLVGLCSCLIGYGQTSEEENDSTVNVVALHRMGYLLYG